MNTLTHPTADGWKKHLPFIYKWEGGRSNDPVDRGGDTMRGITIGTYNHLYTQLTGKPATRENFVGLLTNDKEHGMFVKAFWDKATFNGAIKNEAVAAQVFEWYWGSGTAGIKSWQRMLNEKFGAKLPITGNFLEMTTKATNAIPPKRLLEVAKAWRLQFLKNITIANPSQNKFLKGWTNRVNDFFNFYTIAAGGILLILVAAVIVLR